MKQFVFVLLCAVLPISLFAQTDTVDVPSDAGSGGNLNTAIANVITADPTGAALSNTVFRLQPYGYYILTGTITTPAHAHLYLVGPTPGYYASDRSASNTLDNQRRCNDDVYF